MTGTRFDDFLKFAIKNEGEAARLYEKYAVLCSLPAQTQLLKKMAAMERNHETILKNVIAGDSSNHLGRSTPQDLHISDFLVDGALSSDSSIEDVLIFSIKAEQKAFDLYASLAALEEDPSTKGLLEKLASEEKKHKFDLESQFEKGFMADN